jgi:lipopolysaccharide transport system ATP-binding protein
VSGHIDSTEPFVVSVMVCARRDIDGVHLHIRFTNQDGIAVFTTVNTDIAGVEARISKGRHRYLVQVPGGFLYPGCYTLIVAALIPSVKLVDVIPEAITFGVEDLGSHATLLRDGRLGVVTPRFEWKEVR